MKDDFDNWLSGRSDDAAVDDGRLAPGTVIGDYRVVDLLGRGGFAEVYKAQNAQGAAVAIKVLHRLDEKSRSRFARESAILAQIRHPNIPRLLSFGSVGDRPYMVTELLKAGELPRGGRRIAAFLKQIISAVAELHRHGYVHRDIKPANILFRGDGTPVLIDFGLACPISVVEREKDALSVENGEQLAVGTVGYSAPEQFNGQGAGPEADVHAVGSLIDACFSEGKMPGNWRRVYLSATASNPRSRYQSMAALDRAIRNRHWGKTLVVLLLAALGLAGGLLAYAWSPRWLFPPAYAHTFDWTPNDDEDVADGISEIEVRVWFKSNVAGQEETEEMKAFLEDDCLSGFLDEKLDWRGSAEIRRICGDRKAMLGGFIPLVEAKLKERNEDYPADPWKLEIQDMEFELR